MRKHNRQRRAAKNRNRARGDDQRRDGRPDAAAFQPGAATATIGERFLAAAYARRAGNADARGYALDSLATEPEHEVSAEVARLLEGQVARAWTIGWQPADLARVVDRDLALREAGLV